MVDQEVMDDGIKMDNDIKESIVYLENGGLAEVASLADAARHGAAPKVQMDTDMAIALCMLAAEAIQARQ